MRKFWIRLGLGLAAVAGVIAIAAFFIDEPVRALAERELNKRVVGYSFHIGKVNIHPIGPSVDIRNLSIRQESVPEPPVVMIDRWHASLEWRALFLGRFVSSHVIDRPVLHVTRKQAKGEAEDKIPLRERGWQEVARAIPFKINVIEISHGYITYVDEGTSTQPVQLSDMHARIKNIQNVGSKDEPYPSELLFDGMLLESGHLHLEGRADFLAEPHPAVKVAFRLDKTPLEKLLPVTSRFNLQVRQGTLTVEGEVEYAPDKKVTDVKRLKLERLRADYVHTARTRAEEKQTAKQAVQTVKHIDRKPELLIRIEQATLVNCELGFVDQAADPDYRIVLTDTNATIENFSNRFRAGPASLELEGKFMGTGRMEVTGHFRPEKESPDFDLTVKIVETQMKAMNDLLRAYGKLDVHKGKMSFYSELKVRNGEVHGYFKPLFKDVEVYDSVKDRKKSLLQQLYENIAGGVVSLFQNVPRSEVATKAEISGRLNNPQTDTMEAVLRLIQNAFFKAILPGLEGLRTRR